MNINIVIKLFSHKVRLALYEIKTFQILSRAGWQTQDWAVRLTWSHDPGRGGEEGADTVHRDAALVGPGLAPLS